MELTFASGFAFGFGFMLASVCVYIIFGIIASLLGVVK